MPVKSPFVFFFFLMVFALPAAAQPTDVKSLKAHYQSIDTMACLELWAGMAANIEQVVLIRHGEPDLNKKGWRNRTEARQYMHDYDSVGVIEFAIPPICTGSLTLDTIYHSSIPRASATAFLAFGAFPLASSDRYREFERKTMRFFNIKMPLKFWTTGSRLLWFMGMNKKNCETFRQAKRRAETNATFLARNTTKQEYTILVAHGLHNKYVKKYLRKMGWKKVVDTGNDYLSVKVMARIKEK